MNPGNDKIGTMGSGDGSAVAREFENSICDAFSSGMSVLQICRAIHARKALFIYRILQRRKLVGTSLKRSRFTGPEILRKPLKRSCLSFAQWCNSHAFDPEPAAIALDAHEPGPGRERYLEAARRDFPEACLRNAAQSVDLDTWERELLSGRARLSYHLDWDPFTESYIGTIPGVLHLKITAKRPGDVLADLVRTGWHLHAIARLNALQPHGAATALLSSHQSANPPD